MSVVVKICGITQLSDALAAAEAGADALGFNFCEASPRCLPLATAASIIHALPPSLVKVGVFVNPSPELVIRALRECGLNLLQFHGEEPPEFCAQFGLMAIKAFRVRNADSLAALADYATEAWLLDAYSPGLHGGSGATFNWDLALEAQRFGRPIFLAGGLTPANVADAIRHVRPYGVDVSSGVESAPGKKDHAKIKAFITAARTAAAALDAERSSHS